MAATRLLAVDDAPALCELLRRNRAFLVPWQPLRADGFYTVDGQQESVSQALVQHQAGHCLPLVIVDDRDQVAGSITLQSIIRGAFQSCSVGYWLAEDVQVQLRPRGLDLAARIWQEHGDAVRITVAGQPYPLDPGAVAAAQRPPRPEQTEPWPDGLIVDLRLEQTSTPTGDLVRGRLVLRATTHPVAFDSDQPLTGELLDDAGRRVTSLTGMRIGTGRDWHLRPGEQGEVELTAGTDVARLADGPDLAPGIWQLVLPIPVHRQTPNGLVTTHLIAGPFSVTLTPPAPGTAQ